MSRLQGTLFLPPEKTVSEEKRMWQANGNHLSPDAAAGMGAYHKSRTFSSSSLLWLQVLEGP